MEHELKIEMGKENMAHIMIYTASYLALLLLIMPPNLEGVMKTLALSAAGIFMIVWKKPKAEKDLLSMNSFLITAEIAGYSGLTFFHRWLPSSKVHAIAGMLHLTPETLLFLAAAGLSLCAAVVLLYVINHAFRMFKNTNPHICSLMAAIVTVLLAQFMIEADMLSMGIFKFCWGVLIVSVVIMILYCLSGKIRLSIVLGTALFMMISTVNVYIYNFRGRLFEPVDIFSLRTAMNVADNYSLWPIPATIICAWAIWAGITIFIFASCSDSSSKTRLKAALCCAVGLISIVCYTLNLNTYHWKREGAVFNGYILDFASKFKETYVSEPSGYSEKKIDETAEKYVLKADDGATPHIIVIMDEAFSDLSALGDLSTNQEVMPFISSMKENVVSGYALASVYGGNTANSEYEFLTGNTMAWLSPNAVPYQQYIRSSAYSMVSYLKKHYNYHCVAMHPYLSDGWNRPDTYMNLGFDQRLFVEDFPQKKMIRNYVSDQEMFEKIVEIYENRNEEPLFLFGVTMQNHGDYDYTGDHFNQSVSLAGYKNNYPAVEQYLSLVHETDQAVEYLISYFSEAKEDVVIVFFGDHQPRIDEAFYDEMGAGDAGMLDVQQNRYKVPFFIWTNYDSEEEHVACTSLNYLSSYVYKSAGMELPPYNQFLSELEEEIPAINANGFYSLEGGCFRPLDEASEEEKTWLKLYEMLQYNSLFDDAHRNDKLFITMESSTPAA